MASIEPRDGMYRVRVRRQGAPSISRTFTNEIDARDWAEQTEAAVRDGRLAEHQHRQTTLGSLMQTYMHAVTPKKKGATAEANRIRALMADKVADYNIENLSRQVFRDLRDRRLREVSGPTWNRQAALISAVLKWARAERDVPVDAGALLGGLKEAEHVERERRLEPGEYERLMTAAPTWLRDYIVLAVETAMRRGELAALTWDRIDMRRKLATLPTTKNGTRRIVPLSSVALRTLEGMARPLHGGKVFEQHPDNISKAFADACKSAGIEGLRLHDLRAEAVSRLFERGFDLAAVRAISGHKSSAILRYCRSSDAQALAQRLG